MSITQRQWRTTTFLALLLIVALCPVTPPPVIHADDGEQSFPFLQPNEETFREWVNAYESSARTEPVARQSAAGAPGGSQNLLPYLDYVPAERSQGSCGNCWAWAGTGCMEIALDVQEGVFDRLSVQYINSCQYPITGNPCCDGGWLAYDFVHFYEVTRMCLPWSNTNAQWQDSSATCSVPCGSIAAEPHYDIFDIEALTVPTHSTEAGAPDDAAAIANIKAVLDSDKAVWFAFFAASTTAWYSFTNFWLDSGEDVTFNLGTICNGPSRGPGHAVLCVGYNDEDPDNRYWVMLNSWGTAGGDRPNGLFRIDMDMDYDCMCGESYAFYWQTLDVVFTLPPPPTVSTGATTDIEETSARFNGTLLDDSGEASECRFEWDTSDGDPYSFTTDWQSGLNPGDSFQADLTTLTPGTAYYVRAQGHNLGGTASGDEVAFLTKPLPPEDFSAYATGQDSASLTWTKGEGAERTYVRGKKDSPPSDASDGYLVYDGTGSSCADEGIDAGSSYCYRAWSVADDATLDSVWSDDSAVDNATTIGNDVWMEGDVSLDASADIVDAMLIAQFTVGLRQLDPTQLVCGDTTDDGVVNIVDAMHIAQFTVDPNQSGNVLFKPLWESTPDAGLLDPLEA